MPAPERRGRAARLTAAVCAAHALTMLGFSTFPALMPLLTAEWGLTGTEAGAVSSALFVGYTVAVPVLASLTDRFPARRVYVLAALAGVAANAGFALFAAGATGAAAFSALFGLALAGTYMPGLKLLGEHLDGAAMARAAGFYTATFGVGAAASFLAAEAMADGLGWRWAYWLAAAGSLAAGAIVLVAVPSGRRAEALKPWLALFDPRPVLANRQALRYSLCYGLHCLELFTLRSWMVAFLAAAAGPAALAPTTVAAIVTFAGVPASILGNEWALRLGSTRLVLAAMTAAGLAALAVAGAWQWAPALLIPLIVVHGILVMADSATLTAGAFAAARLPERGLTMAVHSTIGFGGAAAGPLIFGAIVDGAGPAGWTLAYAALALIAPLGIATLLRLRPPVSPAAG